MGIKANSEQFEEQDFSYFQEQLQKNSYSHHLEALALIAGDNEVCFDHLYKLSLRSNEQIAMRASAVIERISRKYPYLLLPYTNELIQTIPQLTYIGLKRNFLKAIRYIDYNDEDSGRLMNICFDAIQSTQQKPAIKVYAMDILLKIIEKYPELIVEFQIILEQHLYSEIPSIAAHTRQLLKKLKRINPNQTRNNL